MGKRKREGERDTKRKEVDGLNEARGRYVAVLCAKEKPVRQS